MLPSSITLNKEQIIFISQHILILLYFNWQNVSVIRSYNWKMVGSGGMLGCQHETDWNNLSSHLLQLPVKFHQQVDFVYLGVKAEICRENTTMSVSYQHLLPYISTIIIALSESNHCCKLSVQLLTLSFPLGS